MGFSLKIKLSWNVHNWLWTFPHPTGKIVPMHFSEVKPMKELRRKFNRFCFRNRDKGIPNLMLYICLGTALVYFMTVFTENYILYDYLFFDRDLILRGQVWRLISYPLTYYMSNPLMTAIFLFCYYSIGRAMENAWGTCRFNLYYLCGIVMMDVYCMIFDCQADVYYLNLSLFLGYATMYPEEHFLVMFIIPIKAWILALVDLAFILMGLFFDSFPYNLFSVISLANYFLFFGKDVVNVLPPAWRYKVQKKMRKQPPVRHKVIRFDPAQSQRKEAPQANYTHRCTVCGRTDVSNPDLEFRYCSRCKGYYCYCEEHISNHSHIE